MAFDYSKLRGRIIEKFGSIKAFAEADGRSFVTISKKLNNKVVVSPDDIVKWSSPELLDIQPSDYHLYYFAKKVHEV